MFRSTRTPFLGALAGVAVGAMLVAGLPALAGNGEPLVLGEKNTARTVTKLNTRGGLKIVNFKAGNSALSLEVVGDTPPMEVNSTGLVSNFNADLLDGLDSAAFSASGHDHGGGCPLGMAMRGLDGDGDVICTAPPMTSITVASAGSVGSHSSLVLDASGYPVIAYFDSAPNLDLKLARCGDAICSEITINTVESNGNVGQSLSLALDGSGFPVISYVDATNEDLKVAHCVDAFCGAAVIKTVDDTGWFQDTSLVLDASGYPVISYYDNPASGLNLAHCSDANCVTATINTVDGAGIVGQHSSLVLDASGYPVISYYDIGSGGGLKVAHCGDANCSTPATINSVDTSGDVGWDTSLALDGSGYPVISYYAWDTGDLKVAHCSDANCAAATINTLDDTGGSGSSLVLDASGYPVISYYDDLLDDLNVARCRDADCAAVAIYIVSSDGNVGQSSSLALDPWGFPVISHFNATDFDLELAFL